MTCWKPISTAPRHGEQILGWSFETGVVVVTCDDVFENDWWMHAGPNLAHGLDGYAMDTVRLTHWMPLPDPPVPPEVVEKMYTISLTEDQVMAATCSITQRLRGVVSEVTAGRTPEAANLSDEAYAALRECLRWLGVPVTPTAVKVERKKAR